MRTSMIALGLALASAAPAHAEDNDASSNASGADILVIAQKQAATIENAPSTKAVVTEAMIAEKINAVSVEDTIKYLPSLVVRKRHIGDNFAPIATRTSGLGSSARSLIYADGAILSALIGNNNGNGSPRWTLVTPEEIGRVDVLYGPFSAAYPGNSIGTVVNITTRLPDTLEARATVLTNIQKFDLYGTHQTLPTWQFSGSVGDRFGPLAVFLSGTRTVANSQPVTIVSATSAPAGTSGAYDDRNRTGGAIKVLGAGGIEHHEQNTWKAKAALDLGGSNRLSYVLGIWTDKTRGTVDSYLRDGSGTTTYATAANGVTSGFNSGVYTRDALHFSHALTAQGGSKAVDWQVVGTIYNYAHDLQNGPSTATSGATLNRLPAAFAGGAGTIQRQDGTGWQTIDAKAALHLGAHEVSFGGHGDRYKLNAATYLATDWRDDATQGALSTRSRGKTRTLAVWAQDAVKIMPDWTLTIGARQEWWRAWDGFNLIASGASISQPARTASGFSPKASIEWKPASDWSVRLSGGQAWRFPTVGELYQAVSVGTLLSNPNPNLRPERARSAELAIEHHVEQGTIRLSLFNEVVKGALISQTNVTTPTITTSYVQNVDRTRARGVELAIDRRDVVQGLDVAASVTYADAITSANAGMPASVGKLLPSVPHWKANAVLTWRPSEKLSLTGAARYASRNYATLDNSDIVGNTYQGFYKYFVMDARAVFHVNQHFDFALGVDNLNNAKYFLFHPFPQRSFTAQASWKL